MKIAFLFLLGLTLSLIYVFGTYPVEATVVNTYQVSQSSDDCTKYSTTSFSLNMTEVRVGVYLTVTYNDNGFRFQNIQIPQNTNGVKKARIKLYGAGYSGSETYRLYYEDIGDSTTFSDLADFDSRTKSTLYVQGTTGWIPAGTYITITGLISNVVLREDFASGNAITIFLTHISGTGYRRGYSYDRDSNYAAILEITWYSIYYVTYYTNNANSNCLEYGSGQITIANGTTFGIAEENVGSFHYTLNGSYVFRNWVNNLTGNASENYLELTITLDYGNFTLWAYSDAISIGTDESFTEGIFLGAIVLGAVGLFGFLFLLVKKHG